jgi:hypothetical protein
LKQKSIEKVLRVGCCWGEKKLGNEVDGRVKVEAKKGCGGVVGMEDQKERVVVIGRVG